MSGGRFVSVVHLETGRHLYGGALQVLYLAQGLEERGIKSVLMVPRESEIAAAARKRWLRVEEFPYHGEGDVVAAARMLWRFSRRDVEMVHLHSRRGADTLGGLAATLVRAPVVLTRRVDNREVDWLVGAKYALYRRVVAISGAVRDVLTEQGVPPGKISLVPSAVDASNWLNPEDAAARDHEFDLPPGVPAGAMVAQFVPRKGHWVLMHALSILKVRGHTPNVVLFGRGPTRDRVAALAEAAGVLDQIRFAGFRDDLHRWLGSFDFCVHPALKEGLGVAALQAGAAGIPVVGARAGGIPEVVEDGETGLLCPPSDADALAAAIEQLIDDPKTARAMGQRARARIESRFSVDAMVEGNLKVYREVVGSGRRSRAVDEK